MNTVCINIGTNIDLSISIPFTRLKRYRVSILLHRSPKGRLPQKKESAAEGENLPAGIHYPNQTVKTQ
jgi:hypothetical protein